MVKIKQQQRTQIFYFISLSWSELWVELNWAKITDAGAECSLLLKLFTSAIFIFLFQLSVHHFDECTVCLRLCVYLYGRYFICSFSHSLSVYVSEWVFFPSSFFFSQKIQIDNKHSLTYHGLHLCVFWTLVSFFLQFFFYLISIKKTQSFFFFCLSVSIFLHSSFFLSYFVLWTLRFTVLFYFIVSLMFVVCVCEWCEFCGETSTLLISNTILYLLFLSWLFFKTLVLMMACVDFFKIT